MADDSREDYWAADASYMWELALSGQVADRAEIIARIATLPDEAFGYIALQLWQTAKANGGFQEPSKVALHELSGAFERWIQQKRDGQ